MWVCRLRRQSLWLTVLVSAPVRSCQDAIDEPWTHHDVGYTSSRAILSDAIALTRGDRFFTHDFTPYNLTTWGFADCQRNPKGFGFGSQFARLLLRTLPRHYSEDSVYTYFAFMTPDAMQKNLNKLGVLKHYDLNRPQPQMRTHHFTDYHDVVQIRLISRLPMPNALLVFCQQRMGEWNLESLRIICSSYPKFLSCPERADSKGCYQCSEWLARTVGEHWSLFS